MKNFISDDKTLRDISQTGKERPWRKHKLESLAVAKSMSLFEELQWISSKIKYCGCSLTFKSCPNGHGKKLCHANFCKGRGCILCNFRKSMITYHQVLAIVHRHKEIYPTDIPLMLTLTVPNCSGDKLRFLIKKMSEAFKKLSERKFFKDAVRGWFRSLEVSLAKDKTYHPHYHILLMVPKKYFERNSGLYIDRDLILKAWQECMKDYSITQVDIRRIKRRNKNGISDEARLIGEVAKYATKPSSYITKVSQDYYYADPKAVKDFHYALRGIRLLGFGGLFKKIRRELKQEDVEKSDLIKISTDEKPCFCDICSSEMKEEIYMWGIGNLKDYVKQEDDLFIEGSLKALREA